MRALRVALSILLLLVAAPRASAAVLRYALVVGANEAIDVAGAPRPPLLHAESDARELHAALLEHSGFGSAPRTRLLVAPSRADFRAAVAELGRQIAADRRHLPDAQVLFALFYSGHGSEGNLLLRDGPIGAAELAALLDSVPADMRIGSFDACNSASLADSGLIAKGMTPLPDFDLISALPDATLNAEGSIWFFSSRADESSFEDKDLGGLFTHFFVEGMRRAPRDGMGVTLDAIWEYARAKTVEFAHRRHRSQTPLRMSKTSATGPLHFAWRRASAATLVVAAEVAGKLALYYEGDRLVAFDKRRGDVVERHVYPGVADVVVLGDDYAEQFHGRLELPPGGRVVLGPAARTPMARPFGYFFSPLGVRGAAPIDDALHAHGEVAITTVSLRAGYALTAGGADALAARHLMSAGVRFDHGPWVASAQATLGLDSADYPAWGYALTSYGGALSIGYGVDLGGMRLAPFVAASLAHARQTYADDEERQGRVASLGAGLSLAIPIGTVLALELAAEIGSRQARGVGVGSGYGWSALASGGVGLFVRIP
ncbi:MAG: caspase family protein [Deltaproteobacteria bacterium]|nr:caspase family protein [Deltaproteobacteria bacterium]